MALISSKYALRSVGRNPRRTALSVLGIGIGCMLALVTESINRGRDELFARMGAYSGAGHLRVVPQGWRLRRDPRLRLADVRRDLAAARSLPGVAAVTVRAHAQVLLAMGTHVVALEMVGVDPESEPSTNRFVRNLERGRYLAPGERGAAVVGRAVAERLRADLDDEILATAVGKDGDIEAALYRIV
ncbi:MAG TPA: ABC transporter permease, partial [Vicinamibacteria bacterium]